MNKNLKTLYFVFAIFMVSFCSCKIQNVDSQVSPLVMNSANVEYEISRIEIQAKQTSGWESQKLKQIEGISSLFFKDSLDGWVGADDGFVYKTNDSGLTWNKLSAAVPEGFTINKISFVNSNIGWLIANRDFSSFFSEGVEGFQGVLMKTEDGGKTWKQKVLKEGALIKDVSFIDQNNIWLIGATFDKALVNTKMLILRSKDEGGNWDDLSKELNTLLAREDGFLNEVPVDVNTLGLQRTLILTSGGKVFETFNGGENWSLKTNINGDYAEFLSLELSLGNDLYIVGSLDSIEGMYSIFGIEQNKNHWISYTIKDFSITDIKSLSSDEIIACGTIRMPDKHDSQNKEYRYGALIHSYDKGISWSLIYQMPQPEKQCLIHVLSSSQAILVGGKGEVINLTKK